MFRTWCALVFAVPALAFAAPSARLLDDAPRFVSGSVASSPRLIDQAVAAAEAHEDCHCECDGPPRIGYGELFAKTTAAGVFSSATGMVVGAGLGALSNNLIGAAIPGLLIANLILPPLLTVLAANLIGNWDEADRFGFWLPFAGAFVVNAAAVVITGLFFNFAVGITNPLSMVVFALVDGVLMSGATTGLMALGEKKKVSTVRSFAPGVTDTTFVALQEVKF